MAGGFSGRAGVRLVSEQEPGNDRERRRRLSELDRRISAARDAGKPKPRADKDKYAAMSMGWRMIIELTLCVVVGAAMGWGLDWLFGTLPAFLIVFCMLGFASGVRSMMRTAEELQRDNAGGAGADEAGKTPGKNGD